MRATAFLLFAVALGVFAAPAQAAITQSQVTSSNVKTFDYRNDDLGSSDPVNTRTVSGTSDGTAGEQIFVWCISEDGRPQGRWGGTTVQPGGTWRYTGAVNGASSPCRLYALPPGDSIPADLTPFAPGETIYPGSMSTATRHGKLFSWSIDHEPRKRGYAGYGSLGCGLCGMSWRDDNAVESFFLWNGNASIGGSYYYDEAGAGAVRLPSSTVDGDRAYASLDVANDSFNATSDPEFVPLTFSHSVDQTTGDTTTTSTEALMTCPGGCGSDVVDTGIRVDRTTQHTHEGQVFSTEDVWRNTSGSPRDLSLGYLNFTRGGAGVELPGESGFTKRRNTVVDIPASDSSTITVVNEGDQDFHQRTNPVGTLSAAPTADDAVFTDWPEMFLLRYGFTLPAGATKTISQAYTMGGTMEATRALGAEAEDGLVAPTIAIDSPSDDVKVESDEVAVKGTASDNAGVESLTVNGVDTAVADDGTWTATVPLKPGANTIEAVAADATGNTASASRKVTFTPKASPVVTQPVVTPAVVTPPVVTPPGLRPPALLALLRKAGDPKARGNGRVLVDTGLDVSCPAGGPACTALVSATAPLPVKARKKNARSAAAKKRRTTIGRKSLTIPAGATQRVRIRLSPAASRELRRRGSLTMVLKVVLRVGNAAATTSAPTITVKAPARKQRKPRG